MQTTSSVVSLLLVCMSCIMVAEWCLVVGAKILKRHCKGFIKGFIEYTSTRKGKIVKERAGYTHTVKRAGCRNHERKKKAQLA